MNLSNDLITQFVKLTNDKPPKSKTPTISFGTATKEDGKYFVKLDGGETKIPADISKIASGVNIVSSKENGTRVVVLIENHSACIIASLEQSGNVNTTLEASGSIANYIQFDTDGLTIGDRTSGKLGSNVLIGVDDVKIRTGATVNAVFGSDNIELLDGRFKIRFDNNNLESGFGIYGKSRDGNDRLAFQPVNENGNTTLGWGNYATRSGNTNVYGKDVHIGVSYNSINTTFRPYYRKGDSFATSYTGSGYITSGGKALRFSVPVSKPIIGNPRVSIKSNGFTLRQGGKYTHGSTDSSTAQPATITATLGGDGNFVMISAEFDDITNVTNNDAIGINWNGTITFI